MNANEFRLWLEGFQAAGGDPRSLTGRVAIERALAGEEPDPVCAECEPIWEDCERRPREQWHERYLSYYKDEPAGSESL
jgi:hypothetical protein